MWSWKPKHEHRLRVASCDIPPPSAPFGVDPRVTIVLLRCPCGEGIDHLASITLPGHFMLPDLRGDEGPSLVYTEFRPPAAPLKEVGAEAALSTAVPAPQPGGENGP